MFEILLLELRHVVSQYRYIQGQKLLEPDLQLQSPGDPQCLALSEVHLGNVYALGRFSVKRRNTSLTSMKSVSPFDSSPDSLSTILSPTSLMPFARATW